MQLTVQALYQVKLYLSFLVMSPKRKFHSARGVQVKAKKKSGQEKNRGGLSVFNVDAIDS